MKVYEVCSQIYRHEGNVAIDLRVESPGIAHFYGASGVNGRISDVPAYLGGEECRCMPDMKSAEPRYIITL